MARAVGDFTSGNVTRGRLTNYRTADFVDFVYNPATIKEKKGANISEDPIPGMSDPLLRWAAGKSSTISFSLDLDGESTLRRFGSPLPNFASSAGGRAVDSDSFTIQGEIAFFESFQFGVDPNDAGSDGGADRVVFSFGPRYPGVLCVVEDVDIDITLWSPDLEPVRARVGLVLKRWVVGNRFASSIWKGG